MIRQTLELCRLHAKVFEGLGCRVNDLVNELALDFVGRCGMPPERAIENVCGGLEEGFRNVNVAAFLDNLAIYYGRYLSSRVVCGTEQFESLRSCGIVIEHLLKRFTDIDGLAILAESFANV